jgi:hypothetical protein
MIAEKSLLQQTQNQTTPQVIFSPSLRIILAVPECETVRNSAKQCETIHNTMPTDTRPFHEKVYQTCKSVLDDGTRLELCRGLSPHAYPHRDIDGHLIEKDVSVRLDIAELSQQTRTQLEDIVHNSSTTLREHEQHEQPKLSVGNVAQPGCWYDAEFALRYCSTGGDDTDHQIGQGRQGRGGDGDGSSACATVIVRLLEEWVCATRVVSETTAPPIPVPTPPHLIPISRPIGYSTMYVSTEHGGGQQQSCHHVPTETGTDTCATTSARHIQVRVQVHTSLYIQLFRQEATAAAAVAVAPTAIAVTLADRERLFDQLYRCVLSRTSAGTNPDSIWQVVKNCETNVFEEGLSLCGYQSRIHSFIDSISRSGTSPQPGNAAVATAVTGAAGATC